MTSAFDCLSPLVLGLGLLGAPEPQASGDAVPEQESQAQPPGADGWQRDGLTFNKGHSKIVLRGYAQGDLRARDWSTDDGESGGLPSSDHRLRRLRMGVEGELGAVSFEFMVDPRNSQKGSRLKDVTIGYGFSEKLNLLVGHFKPPISVEYLTSVSKSDFNERSMLGARLVPGRDWGFELSGALKQISYSAGIFAGDDSAERGVGTSVAARMTVEAVKDIRIAGSFMQGRVTADPRNGTAEPEPKGASGVTASGFTFWNSPHMDGMRRRMGADVTYERGPLRIRGEYLQAGEERLGQGSGGQDIPDVRGRGWSAQASFVFFGERASSTVRPRTSVFSGGPGALEVVARAEALKFDDTGNPVGPAEFGNRSRNLAPSGATALQAGLNYWFSRSLKVQGSALWESYNDPLIAPTPGRKGRYFTFFARLQVMLP